MTKREEFEAAAKQFILIKDGPYGTAIQRAKLAPEDYAGDTGLADDQKGNNDLVNLTQPQVIRTICDSYIDAGAHILATNTFNANRISQADYGAEGLVRDINISAARIIREAIDARNDGVPRFVAGAVGPTNKTLSLSPDVEDPGFREVTFDEIVDVYREQCAALVEGGADFILIETVFDTLNCKAAIMAVKQLERELNRDIPLMISLTLTDLSGRNLSGHTVEAFWYTVSHAKPLTIGLNCSFGAEQLRPHVQLLSDIADSWLMAYPNAGLPNDLGEYDEMPETTAALTRVWAENGRINALGGCCGSTPAHIAAMAKAVEGLAPRKRPSRNPEMHLAGLEPFTIAA
ncbi:homocysteine S-methyltransferase family protein [Qipengyuania citrea]|jgi:5-methyltetrahydrofolate--homocysteine methyltransferase|uniref:Homocysteine S-methyltransferase family protein n=2 Tax=Qipengyuania TaxID=1855416 RepID=A0ABY4U663_9SPHN|nr:MULTISPECIES: homocysteine S-methyltransferase family protein [Erythrobacteraceae]MAB46695.1 5-methyltetrahydrofolate--homocysteine methyltransferase [Sphingomonadaceae bacterium]MBG74511.1 5-methyltetrahydrofolate--homocysteine methyltransferase [Erythrobacteraceae bacterium]MCH2496423.1 homocysteine S-methyltransferase family protein [Erythrobacter sp.]MBX7488756.1 homocysteine S-methyltransferase family protein [Qipengyuania aerophila]MBY8334247.1 homocysteine S-methyltransferase family |tara:strand:- start:338 stop:1378 length:1041 start_codon:yes stop_codon:yes gene_type:complete